MSNHIDSPSDTQTFTWKDIPGYEGMYQASPDGNVRAIFAASNNRYKPGRVLKPASDLRGYLRVTLCKEGSHRSFKVHTLICLAYYGPPPFLKAEVNHLNGIKHDNRVDNLEWCSHRRNELHKSEVLGNGNRGQRNHFCKLSPAQVIEILDEVAAGSKHEDVARKYGVSRSAVGLIVNRKNWGWINWR